jgi:hypothetical protein
MAQYLKIFGEDFSAPRTSKLAETEAATPAPPSPITTEDVDAAYARGMQDGQTTVLANAARQTQEMVQALLLEIGTVNDAACQTVDANALHITQLLLDLLRKFFPRLCAEYGPAETSDMVAIVLAGLTSEPEVEIRACSAGIADLERYFAATPYDGRSKLTLVALETMTPGDAGMRWKDGRADRNARKLWSEILAALSMHGIIDPEPIRPQTHNLIGHAHG